MRAMLLDQRAVGLFENRMRFIGSFANERAVTPTDIPLGDFRAVSRQRHGKDPLAYLRDVLPRLPLMTNQDDLNALAPAHWQPT